MKSNENRFCGYGFALFGIILGAVCQQVVQNLVSLTKRFNALLYLFYIYISYYLQSKKTPSQGGRQVLRQVSYRQETYRAVRMLYK